MWDMLEILKVLIHELVHAFAYDHSRVDLKPFSQTLSTKIQCIITSIKYL